MSEKEISRPGIITVAIALFVFGTIMSSLAAVTLLFPGSSLNVIWKINPRGYEGFLRMGNWSFLVLSSVMVACGACALGLWFRKRWGYWLAVCLVFTNLIADIINVVFIKEYRAAVGIPVAAFLLWQVSRPSTKSFFKIER